MKNTDLDTAAFNANYIIDHTGGTAMERNGMFEVWGEPVGSTPICIGRAITPEGAIEDAIKSLVDTARAQHTFTNISEKWGDFVDATIDDYREMARIFGCTVDIEEREDGIYIDGEQVAE